MSTLVCKDVVKKYKDKVVLKDVNLSIEQGKIYGLIGRNGAGKTTLMSIMTAQNPQTSGRVFLDEQTVWENRKALDHICFSREINTMCMFGANNQKVKEYLRIAAIYYPNWDKDYAKSLIDKFGINPNKKISKLSKGMLSMVTIIIGLASKADITILDEPVAGLDVVARRDFYNELIEEHTSTNRTFVISTHIIEEAADVFEEVIFIHEGKLLLKENLVELLDRAAYITGMSEVVDQAVSGLHVCHEEKMGRSKGATVLLEDGQSIDKSLDITVQPVSLQNFFIALCGSES